MKIIVAKIFAICRFPVKTTIPTIQNEKYETNFKNNWRLRCSWSSCGDLCLEIRVMIASQPWVRKQTEAIEKIILIMMRIFDRIKLIYCTDSILPFNWSTWTALNWFGETKATFRKLSEITKQSDAAMAHEAAIKNESM